MPRPLKFLMTELLLTYDSRLIPTKMKVSDLTQQAGRTKLLVQEKCLALELPSYSWSLVMLLDENGTIPSSFACAA